MTLPPLDKNTVAENWRKRAPAWNRRADEIARMAVRFNEPLVDAAAAGDGDHVLDLASGTGEPALTLARRVGTSGRVTATDLVEEMLEGTRRRAAENGLDNITARIADMEALPFADDSFDRVTCRFGIMFVPDPGRAMAEARRVLKPGGRTAWMVWGPMANTTMFEVIQSEVRTFLSLAPEPDLPQFRFGPAGLLGDVMRGAGFVGVEEQDVRFTPQPKHGSAFWRPQVEMSFGHDLVDLDPARRAELDDRIARAFEAHRDGDAYRLNVHVRIGTGVKPA